MYQHIISLGHFCAVASELDKLGFREASLPFDWIISPLDSVIDLINNNFEDFLNPDLLYRDSKRPYIVLNKRYNIAFYHDFKESIPIEEQVSYVQKKYDRRISRFYEYINEKTLFVRYIETKQEYEYISENYDSFLGLLRRTNSENDLILISKDIKGEKLYTVYEHGKKRGSPQRFVKINKALYKRLTEIPYPEDKKRLNLKRYRSSLPERIVKSIKKTTLKLLRRFR